MKITLDTKQKTILIQEKTNIKELIDTIKKLLPNNEWEKYSVMVSENPNIYTSPVIIREIYPLPIYTPTTPSEPTVYCYGGNNL